MVIIYIFQIVTAVRNGCIWLGAFELPRRGLRVVTVRPGASPHVLSLLPSHQRKKHLAGEMSPTSCVYARTHICTLLLFCVAGSFLISGGFDKTVAIWDVGEGYRKLALKVPVATSERRIWAVHHSCSILGAGIKGSQTWVPPKERTRHVCVKASTPITNSKERDVVAGRNHRTMSWKRLQG